MPTPVGHAVGGLATAWFAQSLSPRTPRTATLGIACALAATVPDLDILFGMHRTGTHSIAAALIAAAVAWLTVRRRTGFALVVALTIGSAYASHALLDWLGKDSSMPPGLMVLWPFSTRFYISGVDLFGEVSRRYWKPDEFIVGNLLAVAREMLILGPVALVAWMLRSKPRTKN